MEKIMPPMDGKTMDIVAENVGKLKELFPEAFTEGKVDFEALKEVLGTFLDDRDERYSFTWNGKSKARMIAQTPSTGTLRPCKDESVDWDATQNIFIEGDNLEVLKLLQKSYHKKVKMIYIDPPYNTGKDFVYKDNFKDNIKNYKEITGQVDGEGRNLSNNPETSGRYHTDWLNMMYPRLKLARNLLKDDGVIFISIDDNEVSNLRKMCDEIFGEENFVGQLILQTATDNNKTQVNTEHEYILVFSRDKNLQPYWARRSEAADLIQKKYKELKERIGHNPDEIQIELRKWIKRNEKNLPKVTHYDNVDSKGVFHDGDIANTKYGGYEFDVIHPITKMPCKIPDKGFRFPENTMREMILSDDIMFGNDHTTLIKPKKRLDDAKDVLRSIIYEDGRGSTKVVESLLGRDVFKNPKSHFTLGRLIEFVTNDNDLILDFFAGSSSTAHGIFEATYRDSKSRNYLLVQLPEKIDEKDKGSKRALEFCRNLDRPEVISEISKERIRRAATKIKEENPEYDGDLGFKVFKLDSTNIKPWEVDFDMTERTLEDFISNIKTDRREEDVLYEVLLKYGLDLTLPITEHSIAGQKVFDIGMGALIICLSDAISLEVVEGIAKLKDELNPEILRVIFKDSGFKDDVVKTNAVQILRTAGIVDVRSL